MSIDPDLSQLVDELVAEAIEDLPGPILARLEEVPVVLLDEPDARMAGDVGLEHAVACDELCGLHTGVALTERSIEHTVVPDVIHLFRRGLLLRADELSEGRPDAEFEDVLFAEVRITLLHEIGHHFGLDEDDLEDLGYA